MEFELLESGIVPLEVAEIVPAHSVDVSLSNLLCELGVVGGHEQK